MFSRVGSLLNAMTTSQDSNAEEYHSVLTSIGEAGLWNEKGRIATRIDRLTEASREVRGNKRMHLPNVFSIFKRKHFVFLNPYLTITPPCKIFHSLPSQITQLSLPPPSVARPLQMILKVIRGNLTSSNRRFLLYLKLSRGNYVIAEFFQLNCSQARLFDPKCCSTFQGARHHNFITMYRNEPNEPRILACLVAGLAMHFKKMDHTCH